MDDLRFIGSKLSYRLEMTRLVFDRAVTAGDAGLLAKTAAAGYMLDDIINGCEVCHDMTCNKKVKNCFSHICIIFQLGSRNEFEFAIRSTLVFDSNEHETEGYLYHSGELA